MKRLAVFTSARSDFGLLRPFIAKASTVSELHLVVGGAHFATSRGCTIREIREFIQGLDVRLIPMEFLVEGETPAAQAKSVALGQSAMAQILSMADYDALVFLGDRWELFAASIPALLFSIPLVHISGGEVTEGVIDDSVRHAHSKLAHLHFVAARAYAENLSRMGEEDWRITVSGECGLDSIHTEDIATPEEVNARFGIDLRRPGLLVTFHPTTLDLDISPGNQVEGLIEALGRFPGIPIILTAPGMEQGAEEIQGRMKDFARSRPEVTFVTHLGNRNYLAVLRASSAVVGNSSSGVVEAASFGVPTVNIGNRQRGRLAADSVLHVSYEANEIAGAIQKALSPQFQGFSHSCLNPYDPHGDGRNSERILYALLRALETYPKSRLLAKRLDFDIRSNEWDTLLKDFR